jgi:predicted DNA binding CopG/RHH family protein
VGTKSKELKVILPSLPECEKVIQTLPPIASIRRHSGRIEIKTPIGWDISSEFDNIPPRKLRKLFKQIIVENGTKRFNNKNNTIIFEPIKNGELKLRISSAELEIIKEAAKKSGITVSRFCRSAIFHKAIEILQLH